MGEEETRGFCSQICHDQHERPSWGRQPLVPVRHYTTSATKLNRTVQVPGSATGVVVVWLLPDSID